MTKMKEIILTEKFLSKFPDFPAHMNAIGKFVYLRTYSRFLPSKGRRETWKETCVRAVQYNVNLARKHIELFDLPITYAELKKEAEDWFTAMFNLDQFLSGRTLWVGGAETGVGDKFPLGNFNCSFTTIEKWEDICEAFYLLMLGVGVGFKRRFKVSEDMAPVRDNFRVTHKEYVDLYAEGVRVAETSHFVSMDTTKVTIYIGDSKEGWVEALRLFFEIITLPQFENITEIHLVYDYIRKQGTPLKTFGGTASGFQSLKSMFCNIERAIKNQVDPLLDPPERIDPTHVRLRPIHILDICNFLGYNVQVGGVRRTSEIDLIDEMNDMESIFAKYGLNGFWSEEQFQRHEAIMAEAEKLGFKVPESAKRVGIRKHGVTYADGSPAVQFDTEAEAREHAEKTGGSYLYPMNVGTGLHHRRMSNNSVAFKNKPPREHAHFLFLMQRSEGEPAIVNLRTLAMRRLKALGIVKPTEEQLQEEMENDGVNPCGEVLLRKKQTCNLTTINCSRFAKEGGLDRAGLMLAQRRSARAGLRMTLVDMEAGMEEWGKRQAIDRLLGLSLTGWKDMVSKVGLSREGERRLLRDLRQVAKEEAEAYSRKLRVCSPLLRTTTKPEGTQSQLCGSVSNGLHYSHSEYYIRRIRISANDPLAKAVLAHKGWVVNPEVGTEGATREEQMKNAQTLVIDFPVYTGAKVTKEDVDVNEQFDTYYMFMEDYVEHNASNTIDIKNDLEWEIAEERIWNGWDNFVGCSFMANGAGTYALAPYEKIDKETYEALKAQMQDFDMDILKQFETGEEYDLGANEDCAGGQCPIR